MVGDGRPGARGPCGEHGARGLRLRFAWVLQAASADVRRPATSIGRGAVVVSAAVVSARRCRAQLPRLMTRISRRLPFNGLISKPARIGGWRNSSMRSIFPATLCLFCALTYSANGCFSSASEETIFYKAVPPQTTNSIVAKIVITRLITEPTAPHRADSGVPVGSYVAEARVLQLLRGEPTDKIVTIVAPGSDCDDVLKIGVTGIIVGRIQIDPQGRRLLILVPRRAVEAR